MIGVGLGAFVQGMQAGVGIRRQIDADRRTDAIEARNQKRFEREERELDRLERNRDALETIDTEARTEFDRRVKAGEASDGEFERFWSEYALPKRRNELIRQGDFDGATRLAEWGESEAARRGGRLFSSAMRKSQTGDHDGALNDAIEAGKVKGYIESGFEVTGRKPIKDPDGNVVGYRLTIKQGDGDTVEQDVPVSEIPRLIATFANPDAAWQSQQEAAARKTKQDDEVETHRRKKEVETAAAANNRDWRKEYADARKALEEGDLSFSDLTPDEQDQRVRERIDAAERFATSRGGAPAGGAGAPPATSAPAPRGGKIIVDKSTGKPVNPAEVSGIGAAAPEQPMAGVSRPATPARPAPAPVRREPSRQERIDEAAAQIAAGGNPEYVAQQLLQVGIPESEWPEQLRRQRAPQQQ